MCADIYTKAFSDKLKWQSVCALINVVDPKSFSQLVKSKADTLRDQSQGEQSPRAKAPQQDNINDWASPASRGGYSTPPEARSTPILSNLTTTLIINMFANIPPLFQTNLLT